MSSARIAAVSPVIQPGVAPRYRWPGLSADGREVVGPGAGDVLGEMSITVVPELGRAAPDAKLIADTGFAARFYRALTVFRGDRVRNTTARFGHGEAAPARSLPDKDELDEMVLDNLPVAGVRYEPIIMRGRRRLATHGGVTDLGG